MKKLFKKATTIIMAAVMAVGSLGISASAAVETQSWYATYVTLDRVPGSATHTAYVSMMATKEVYTGKVTKITQLTHREVTISSDTHTITSGPIKYSDVGSRSWTLNPKEINSEDVRYVVKARSDLMGISLYAEGTITR